MHGPVSCASCSTPHAAAARRRAARVCTVQCGISAKSQGRPIGPVLVPLFRFGKADAQTSDGFCVFPSSSSPYFMAGRFFLSLSVLLFLQRCTFGTKMFCPVRVGSEVPSDVFLHYIRVWFRSLDHAKTAPQRLLVREDLLTIIAIYSPCADVREENLKM